MLIRPAESKDCAAIWNIIEPGIWGGDTYALDPDMSEVAALGYWLGEDSNNMRKTPQMLRFQKG